MVSESPLHQLPGMSGHRARVEDTLLRVVAAEDELMAQMGGHLITAGGKRARPLFTVASAAALARDPEAIDAAVTDDVVLGGVSVELVQVGSLCHDDVIDEAETRRGVESVNARWGNLKAILAGDFLLAKASEIAAGLGTEVAGLLAATIGKLCEGEVNELRHAYDPARTIESYLTAIEGKTAALFATACRVGGIVGELPRHHIDQLTEFGHRYGMAFQIVDDVLDVIATDEQLGKPAGHDIAEGIYNTSRSSTRSRSSAATSASCSAAPSTATTLDTARRLVRTQHRGRAKRRPRPALHRRCRAVAGSIRRHAVCARAGGGGHPICSWASKRSSPRSVRAVLVAREDALVRGLLTGIAAFRWLAWAWMAIVLVVSRDELDGGRPWLAVALVAAAFVVTALTGRARCAPSPTGCSRPA